MNNRTTASVTGVTANPTRGLLAACILAAGSMATWAQPPAALVAIENSPQAKTDTEKKILDVLDDLDKNQRRGMMNVPLEDARLLRLLTETIGAKRVVEIGTSNGYSGIWFCLALRKTDGHLITHEFDEQRASLARQNFKRAGVESLVTLVEGAMRLLRKLEPVAHFYKLCLFEDWGRHNILHYDTRNPISSRRRIPVFDGRFKEPKALFVIVRSEVR